MSKKYRNIELDVFNGVVGNDDFTSTEKLIWLDVFVDSDIESKKKYYDVDALAEKHNCSVRTIRNTITKLEKSNLLKKSRPRKYFMEIQAIEPSVQTQKQYIKKKPIKGKTISINGVEVFKMCRNEYGQAVYLPIGGLSEEDIEGILSVIPAASPESMQEPRAVLDDFVSEYPDHRPLVDEVRKNHCDEIAKIDAEIAKLDAEKTKAEAQHYTSPIARVVAVGKIGSKIKRLSAEKIELQKPKRNANAIVVPKKKPAPAKAQSHKVGQEKIGSIDIPFALEKKIDSAVDLLKKQGRASAPKILKEELKFAVRNGFVGKPKDKLNPNQYQIAKYNVDCALKILRSNRWTTPKNFVKPSWITGEMDRNDLILLEAECERKSKANREREYFSF
jgi:DNA-binding transcriptional regulator YhcF (GntR family)